MNVFNVRGYNMSVDLSMFHVLDLIFKKLNLLLGILKGVSNFVK